MNIFNKTFLYFACFVMLFLLALPSIGAQSLDYSAIDDLFSELTPTTPGAAVMVTKDGEVVYEKGFGVANLEYNVPVTSSTVFHIASLSKQFTVFAILLLEKEGKLALDDDIRDYLPNLPDFGEKITLLHLATHTSGLRDQWDLLAMSGIRLDDVITQDHVVKLVENQKALNFPPGKRNLYCNTGFTLLAEIVEKVSGKSFADFTKERIFQPLGMENTQFYDDHQKIVPNRAYSYWKKEGQFVKSNLNYATVGATSLFTTAADFSAWAMNFEEPKVGDLDLINTMNQATVLNNERETSFAYGQFIGNYSGLVNYYHTGSDAGYRSYFIRIPEHKLSIAVFSNVSTFNTARASLKIVDHVLAGKLTPNPLPKQETYAYDPVIFTKLPPEVLKAFAGNYWSDEYSTSSEIFFNRDTLYASIDNEPQKVLLPIAENKFKLLGESDDMEVNFSKDKKGMTLLVNAEEAAVFEAYTQLNLQDYIGSYFSEELQTYYHLAVIDGQPTITHNRMTDITLHSVHRNTFLSNNYFLKDLKFVRDEQENITGFKASNYRVRDLWFEKKAN